MPIDLSVLDTPQRSASEQQMSQFVKTTPEEDAYDANVEANPAYDDELSREMARKDEQSPAQQAALKEEQRRRASAKSSIDLSVLNSGPSNIDLSALGDTPSFTSRLTSDYKKAGQDIQATKEDVANNLDPNSLGGQLSNLAGLGMGAIKAGVGAGMQGIVAGAKGLASVIAPGAAQAINTLDPNNAINTSLNQIPGMQTPSAKLGEEVTALPFTAAKTLVDSVDPQYKEALNDLLLVAGGLIGAKLKDKAEVAGTPEPTPLAEMAKDQVQPAAELNQKPPVKSDIDKAINKQNDALDKNVGQDNSALGGQTPDLFGTEDVGTNPFLDPRNLEVDENGIPRLKGESADVQREAFDYPSHGDLLDAATEVLADRAERAIPETQDQISLQQRALWQAEERHEIFKQTEEEKMWRDYDAETLAARIPALRNRLEGPSLDPNRPISNRGGLNRQRGAVDLSGDKYDGWFSKDSLKEVEPNKLVEISTALFRKYAPDVELGENRQGRMGSLENSKGNMPVPRLEVEKIGDTWTVVNHDGRHRSDTLLKAGVSKMPVRLDGDVADFLKENPKTIRSQDMQTILPNPAYKMEAGPNPIDPNGIYSDAEHYDGRPKVMQEADRAVRTGNPNFGKFRQGGGINLSGVPTQNRKAVAEAILTPDKRSGIQFAKDMLAQAAQKTADVTKDIKAQLGLYTGSWRAALDAIHNPESVAHQTALFLNKKIAEAASELHRMNAGFKTTFDKAYDYYGVSVFNRVLKNTFRMDKFKSDLAIALKMEGGAGWFDNENYVPTVKNLTDAGMSPESAMVWHGIHSALDNAWDTLNKAAAMAGVKMPDRVPGYLPHVFKGPYVVRVFKGTGDNKSYYLTHNSHSAQEALAWKHANEKALTDQGFSVEYQPPNAEGTPIADLFRGMWEAKEVFEKNKAMSSLMKGLFESSAQGIVSSVLDRSNPTQIGHALQRVGMTGMDGLKFKEVQDAFKSIEATVHDVNNWYNKVKFVNEVLHPLDVNGLLQKPNLKKAAQNWVMQFMDIDNSIFHTADVKLRDMMINRGLDPQLVAHFFSGATSLFARAYLFGKPAFYAANRLQSTMVPAALMMAQVQNGGKGSIWRALKDAMPEILNAQTIGKKSALLQRGLKDGYISPSFIENMGRGKFKDPVAAYIEETTRAEAYATGFHYFKQFMEIEDAYKAAGQFADQVSVPYSKEYGSPNLFSRLPASLKPMAMFATYNQHMLGLVNAMMKTAIEAKRQGDYAGAAKAASAILVGQGMQTALFGFGGITFMQNWDNIADKMGRWFGYNWPTSKEVARSLKPASPAMAQIAEFGLASKALNADISPSGSGASIQSPLAFTDMLGTVAKLGLYTLGSIKQGRFSREDAWDVIKDLPPQISGPASHFLRGEFLGTAIKQAMGEVKDYSVGPEGIHSKGVELTPMESMETWMGLKSPRMSDIAETDRQLKRIIKSDKVNADQLINMLEETKPSPEVRREAVQMLSKMYDTSPDAILAALQKYQIESKVPAVKRKAMAATASVSAAQRFKEYLELKGQQTYE